MRCEYFDAGVCRSCSQLGEPYERQLAAKDAWTRTLLAPFEPLQWQAPVASPESGFRNKAKLVVGGTTAHPTLGILDAAGNGVDLARCALHLPGIQAVIPALDEFITATGLIPYDVPSRRGELKHLLLTQTPSGEFLLRFVLRSDAHTEAIRAGLPTLVAAMPGLAVVSINYQPEHKAIIEGAEEIVISERQTVPVDLGRVTLHLGPRAFFQTNTEIARALYSTASAWLAGVPGPVTDLYCGVGGFGLHLAEPGRDVLGVEVSAEAIGAAKVSAAELGDAARAAGRPLGRIDFITGDAESLGRTMNLTEGGAGVVVVNPPRRGIGAELATQLENSGVARVLYSSCNPESLARDMAHMPTLRPVRAQVFDMFPQTMHLEALVLLERTEV